MLKQIEKGTRPFMDFKQYTVAILVSKRKADMVSGRDIFQIPVYIRGRGQDQYIPLTKSGVYGDPVNRYKAVDPVTAKQWLYFSFDGVTYTLTNNPVY
jgi:hypothetical protein